MRIPYLLSLRGRAPALGLALALQLAVLWAFIHALIVPLPDRLAKSRETEVILPLAPAPLPVTHQLVPRASGSPNNRATIYVNPDSFDLRSLSAPNTQMLASALGACDPGRYDMASDEIRALCDRIGALIRYDPGHFGMTQEVVDAGHWQRELTRREAPFLMLCMKPHPPANKDMIVAIDLATLACVYDLLMHPYDPEKRARYNE